MKKSHNSRDDGHGKGQSRGKGKGKGKGKILPSASAPPPTAHLPPADGKHFRQPSDDESDVDRPMTKAEMSVKETTSKIQFYEKELQKMVNKKHTYYIYIINFLGVLLELLLFN